MITMTMQMITFFKQIVTVYKRYKGNMVLVFRAIPKMRLALQKTIIIDKNWQVIFSGVFN